MQYLPNFFFAALLMLLGVEITLDWLILSARKVSRPEYALLLATFLAILQGMASTQSEHLHMQLRTPLHNFLDCIEYEVNGKQCRNLGTECGEAKARRPARL